MRILAVDHGEKRIGLALSDPTATLASPLQVVKHVSRLLDAAQVANLANEQTHIPIELFDESFSTQDARATRIEMGVSRKKRAGHMDELAAVMILRSYIESHK
jgi:putative holliday junction resolvase